MELRAATFNIRHGTRPGALVLPGITRRRLGQSVADLDADVLGLQEVDRFVVRSWFADQARQCARFAGATAHRFARGRRLLGGEDGIAVAVRGDIGAHEIVPLPPGTGPRPRVALIATALVRGHELTVATTHLDTRGAVAAEQLEALLAVLARWPRPILLLGDLNVGRDQFAPVLDAHGFDVGPPTLSFPWRAPNRQIDVVAVAGGEIVTASAPEPWTSDHRPIIAAVAL